MKPIAGEKVPKEVFDPLKVIPPPDLSLRKPCSNELFEFIRNLYAYPKSDLDPKIESSLEWSESTTVEKVSFNDSYGEERITAYLFIPRKAHPPFQTLFYHPGSGAWAMSSIFEYGTIKNREVELLTKNGRAFVFPVFKGTFERRGKPIQYEKLMIRIYRDMGRCVDYVETRSEFDKEKFAYQGLSTGIGPVFAALEKRFKVALFLSGGIPWWNYSPDQYAQERDIINFAPRVRIPVLMQNGKQDYVYGLETSIMVLFNLLGTPGKDKFLLLYETGHSVWLLNEYRKDMFDFLDKYLGPAK
jgi:cephalosporin-C deacetylase-like acetyl esterase